MAEPKITKYETPRTIYYRKVDNPAWPQAVTAWGETSRSYLYGGTWRPRKLAKASITIATKQEYLDAHFALNHNHKIGRMVQNLRDPAKLRQIAEIVGYTEGKS